MNKTENCSNNSQWEKIATKCLRGGRNNEII